MTTITVAQHGNVTRETIVDNAIWKSSAPVCYVNYNTKLEFIQDLKML